MEVKFDQTRIPEDVSKALQDNELVLGHMHVGRVLKVLFTGASKFLGTVKSLEKPVALKFTREDGSMIVGAKVEYHKNPEDPENPSAGNWSYIWTFDEADLADATVTDLSKNATAFVYFIAAGAKLYNMRFNDTPTGVMTFNTLVDQLSHWLDDNARDGEVNSIVCDNVMVAKCEVQDGKIVKAIIPDGDQKILIKGDDMCQES